MFPSYLIPALFQTPEQQDYPSATMPLEKRAHRPSEKSNTPDDEESVPERYPSVSSTNSIEAAKQLKNDVELKIAQSGREDSDQGRQAMTLELAIDEMGMGVYHLFLFVVCGCGWGADNLWLNGLAVCLPVMGPSLGVDSKNVKFATLGLTAGLCIGAIFWGALSDKYGRKWAFNITLLVVALSGFLAGCARELWQSAICFGLLGFGLGGNLVVDGTLLLEFLPSRKKWLLTCLSISWGIGALLASTLGWGILPRTSCAEGEMSCRLATEGEPCCAREDNRGWQYVLWTMSGLTLFFWAWRSLAFGGWESPHFLLSNGQITQAVAVVRGVAYLNHRSTWLTKALLNDAGNGHEVATASSSDSPTGQFSLQTFRQLLGERKRCINTILLWFAWAAIGLGFPLYNLFLPQYLANNGTDKPTSLDTTYRSYLVTSATGLAGSIVAAVVINCPILGYRLGCRKTMAASAALSGTFVFLFTVRSNSDWQLGFSSAQAFCQNIMYGTLFAYTPMTFPTMYRGTGTGIGGFLNRLFGTLAPVMAVYLTMSSVKAPIYVSGALFLCAFVAMCFLPIETAPNKARGQRTATPMREVGAS